MKTANYIMQLKEAGGYSWKTISTMSGVPESTIRSIASGSVEQPSLQTVYDIISSMGGSMDELYATPKAIREEMMEVRQIEAEATEDLKLTIRTMREIREEMIRSQRVSYERQLLKMEESHNREIAGLTISNKVLRTALVCTVLFTMLLLVTIIGILIYDLTHLDRGWVQAFFGQGVGEWKLFENVFCVVRWMR